jgi:hypothetical protein
MLNGQQIKVWIFGGAADFQTYEWKKHDPLHSLPDLTVLPKKISVGIYAHSPSIHILPTGSCNLWSISKKYIDGLQIDKTRKKKNTRLIPSVSP